MGEARKVVVGFVVEVRVVEDGSRGDYFDDVAFNEALSKPSSPTTPTSAMTTFS